jgi:hypothetical protein
MAHGGRRAGAGRKPGSVTRKAREIADRSIELGLTPLEYMLILLRDERQDPDKRFEAAKAAAPYVHARLAAVEVTGEITTHHDVSDTPLDECTWATEVAAVNH